jgi:hypothetical protein
MAEHDDDEHERTLDPDRAAILERRKRFIALALSGLSTAACTSGPAQSKPDPCLKTVPRQAEEEEGDDGAAPQPCLSMPMPVTDPQPQPQPQVCLKIAQPPADTGDTGEAAPPEPTPQPCLRKPVPKPCLKTIPSPQPCLKMSQPE